MRGDDKNLRAVRARVAHARVTVYQCVRGFAGVI